MTPFRLDPLAAACLAWLASASLVASAGCSDAADTAPSFASGNGFGALPTVGPSIGDAGKIDGGGGTSGDTRGAAGADGAAADPDAAGEDAARAGSDTDPVAADADPAASDTGRAVTDLGSQEADATQGDAKASDALGDAKDDGAAPDATGLPDAGKIDAALDDVWAEDLQWWQKPLPGEDASSVTGPDAGPVGSADVDDKTKATGLCQSSYTQTPVELTLGGGGKVDIIVFVDTSGSMAQETKWLKTNLNAFATYIQQKGIDFHLILIGSGSGAFDICIAPPLGGVGCTGNGVNFWPVKKPVYSTDGLQKMIQYYPDYKPFLRADAAKNFVAVTDDNSSMTAVNFKAGLAKLPLDPGFPNGFIMHGIYAFGPLANGCPTGAAKGTVYDTLVAETKGAKFQVCLADWTPIFPELAKGIIATAKAECTYAIQVPPGKVMVPSLVKVNHVDGENFIGLTKIANGASCLQTPNGWYFDNPTKPVTVTVCPAACGAFQGGKIAFNFGCI